MTTLLTRGSLWREADRKAGFKFFLSNMIRCGDSLANSFVEVCSWQRRFPIAELGVARDYLVTSADPLASPCTDWKSSHHCPVSWPSSFASTTTACIHFGINTLPTLLSGIRRPAATARSQSLSRIPRATAPTHPHIFEAFQAASLRPSSRSPQLVVQSLRKLP